MQNFSSDHLKSCNEESVSLMAEQKYLETLTLLSPLVATFNSFTSPSFAEVVALNNLAFACNKLGQPHTSLNYLAKASMFEPTSQAQIMYKIGTLLNLCAINTVVGYFKTAKKEGYNALKLLEKVNMPETEVLVHFNMANIWISLKKHKKAEGLLKTAAEIAEIKLGTQHPLAAITGKALEDYQKKLKSQNMLKNTSFSSKIIPRMQPLANNARIFMIHKLSSEKPQVKPQYYPKKNHNSKNSQVISISMMPSGQKISSKVLSSSIGPTTSLQESNDYKYPNTPKTLKKKLYEHIISSRSTAISSLGASFNVNARVGVQGRVNNISDYLSLLQNDLNQFTSNSKAIMRSALLESATERNECIGEVFES